MTKVVAVDDEPLALRRVEHLVEAMKGVEIVGTARTCAHARQLIAERQPDVVLLDIRIGDGSGLNLAQELTREGGPAVIFVTAFSRFAVKAFEIAAIDYILKPAEPERLAMALQRAGKRAADSRDEQLAELRAVIDTLREAEQDNEPAAGTEEVWVRRSGGDFVRVPVTAIQSIASDGPYVSLDLGDRAYLHKSTLSAMERLLDPARFMRIHRATIVRVSAVDEVQSGKEGMTVRLVSGKRHKVGRIYGRKVRDRLRARSFCLQAA